MVRILFPLTIRGQCIPALLLAVSLSLGGCASVPPPDNLMNQAQAQLQSARVAGAPDYDPVDFGFAQVKFQQAQQAMVNRKYALAAALADESRATATLARTKAQLAGARAQLQSKTEANNRLRAQNAEVQAENEQHYQQQKARLAAQMAVSQQQGDGQDGMQDEDNLSFLPSAPAAASSSLPPQAPMQEMPAPPSSMLGQPRQPSGRGFQTVPDPQNSGGQP